MKGDLGVIVVQYDFQWLEADGAERNDGCPCPEQVVGEKGHLVLVTEVLDHVEVFPALGRPGAVPQVVSRPSVAGVEIDDFVRQSAVGLRADFHERGQQMAILKRFEMKRTSQMAWGRWQRSAPRGLIDPCAAIEPPANVRFRHFSARATRVAGSFAAQGVNRSLSVRMLHDLQKERRRQSPSPTGIA